LPWGALAQDKFNWAWEQPAETGVLTRAAEAAPPSTNLQDAFRWSWEAEGEAKAAPTVKPAQPAAASMPPQGDRSGSPTPGVGVSAYNELIKENRELRKQVGAVSQVLERERREKGQLKAEVRDLEQRVRTFAEHMTQAGKERAAPALDLDKVVDLEAQLSEAEDQKAKLKGDLDELQKTILDLTSVEAKAAAMPAAGVLPGSDLFKDVKEENARLKTKVARLEAEFKKANREREKVEKKDVKAARRERELEEELAQARSADKGQRRRISDLLKQIPDMEEELDQLKGDMEKKDAALSAKEKDLETLLVELRRRELRLMKAERMAELLDKTREEVKQVDDRQKIDMHFNMAAVYAKEGRLKEAEREYLRALRLDPNDPEVHYNLGILYDDELNETRRAAMHYRKYLKLRPHAADVDQVKQWLMRTEMNR